MRWYYQDWRIPHWLRLSGSGVVLILPDWQSKRLHKVMAEAIDANKQYLAQIIGQYRIGKKIA